MLSMILNDNVNGCKDATLTSENNKQSDFDNDTDVKDNVTDEEGELNEQNGSEECLSETNNCESKGNSVTPNIRKLQVECPTCCKQYSAPFWRLRDKLKSHIGLVHDNGELQPEIQQYSTIVIFKNVAKKKKDT